jgi:hypothetical protein
MGKRKLHDEDGVSSSQDETLEIDVEREQSVQELLAPGRRTPSGPSGFRIFDSRDAFKKSEEMSALARRRDDPDRSRPIH